MGSSVTSKDSFDSLGLLATLHDTPGGSNGHASGDGSGHRRKNNKRKSRKVCVSVHGSVCAYV